jgi:hypothetical protein
MEEKRNFFVYVRDCFRYHLDIIKQGDGIGNKLFSMCVLVVMVAVGVIVALYMFNFSVDVINFLAQPNHTPLMIIARGLVAIFMISLIINSFGKLPKPRPRDIEKYAIKRTLAKDLLPCLQDLAPMYGLQIPDGVSCISGFGSEPCEEVEGVDVYIFTVEKDISSDKQFDSARFRKSLIRRLKRQERDFEISTATPLGYVVEENELCSILVMCIEDMGDYIMLEVARADDQSYQLFKRLNEKHVDDHGLVDPDF